MKIRSYEACLGCVVFVPVDGAHNGAGVSSPACGSLFFLNSFILSFSFEMEFHSCCPSWCAMARSQLTATSASRVQAISPASASQVAGNTGTCHHTWLIFAFLVERSFQILSSVTLKVAGKELRRLDNRRASDTLRPGEATSLLPVAV